MKTLLFLILSIGQASVAGEPVKLVKCQNLKIIRLLEIQKKDGEAGCETIYTKDGVSRVEGSGQNVEGCNLVLGNIQKNLENAHWKCKDISKLAEFAR